MKPILTFVKAHAISLGAGLAALVFIALAALGMTSKSVVEKMQARVGDAGIIGQLKNSAKNEEAIAAEKKRGEEFDQEFKQTLEQAFAINRREVLMPGVFPQPERATTPFDFRKAYQKAMQRLMTTMAAGDLPNAAEVQEEAENVAELLERERQKAEEGGAAQPSVAQAQPPTAPPPQTERIQEERGEYARGPVGGPGFGASTNVPQGDPRFDANFRAHVTKARSIRTYASPHTSFHVSTIVGTPIAPTVDDMWVAQVGLWLQQDIAEAIAKLNDAAAREVKEGEAFVEQMPVKRLVRTVIHGYVGGSRAISFGDPTGAAAGSSGMPSSFTARTASEQFDVVRFTIDVIVDQRDLLKLIDAVCRQNFYQCIDADYVLAPAEAGYFYGTDPVVRATLVFEGYMAREIYAGLMPTGIRKALGIEKGQE